MTDRDLIRSLKLPSTYRTIEVASGHLPDKRLVAVRKLHSGTAGHVAAYVRYLDGSWTEIDRAEYLDTIKKIFEL